MRNPWKCFQATLAAVVTLYLLTWYNITQLWRVNSSTEDSVAHVIPSGYRIRTPGCSLAKYDAFHPSIAHLYQKVEDYQCPGKPNFITTRDERPEVDLGALSVHGLSAVEELRCTYREIYRNLSLPVPDDQFFFGPQTPLEFGRPLNKEFLFVECATASKPDVVFHQQFLFNPILKPAVEERCRHVPERTSHQLNVLVLGVDSVSYLNFDRHLPLSADFIRNHLESFELHGYNKIGDNSFPNQCPLLMGRTSAETMNLSVNNFFDNLDFVWNLFADRGYRTMFLEESPKYGLFNYMLNGFHSPPTDYYLRPAIMAMDKSDLKKFVTCGLACLGPTTPIEMFLDYLARFIIQMDDRPFFSYTFLSEASHDSFNCAGYADAPLKRFFDKVEMSGALNRTVLVFLSDHGMRYDAIRATFIGKFEDRQPFAFLAFPRWFLNKHPDVRKALKTNQRRLTTHFDVHATLGELVDFPQKTRPRTKHGISLFHEVPGSRTCADASISHQWCSCEAKGEPLSPHDPVSEAMAQSLVGQINVWLQVQPRQCYPFRLRNVIDVTMVQKSEEERLKNISHYWITIDVSPSGAIFEATVRLDETSGNVTVLDQVSRCNFYYSESYCIRDHWLEKFCFCRRGFGIDM
ncbi:uncharacterized protein LOC135370786 [Ornithodoros turicata]|uniref:uncharacterized protein LOC135370786 n=1 Tax=Ornithodoros turicata TaxID=34597 RepID=UPI00313A06ED